MKNIIICCDGTGNEIGSEVINVFRINRIADESGPHQVVYYDEGIGTENEPKPWGRLTQKIGATLAQATGSGIERKVIGAYEFLMLNYQPKDRIFLFGFSRGAYAVRMLAAMIHKIGLLPPSKRNLIGKGLIRFEQFSSRQGDDGTTIKTSENDRSDEAYMFGRLSKSRWITIDFVGVWDTVASLIRPRPKNLNLPGLRHLAYTRRNPSVRVLINNAGIAIRKQLETYTLDEWREVLDINLTSAFLCSQAVYPHMIKAGAERLLTWARGYRSSECLSRCLMAPVRAA